MPLLRAGDVRARVGRRKTRAPTACLNALVAGGRCAGRTSCSLGSASSPVSSMGPTSVDVGGPRSAGQEAANLQRASMGPTSVDVGGPPRSRAPRRPCVPGALMGPTSVDVGGPASCRSTRWSKFCLNGADISRCRKAATTSAAAALSTRASMGPTSVDVGRGEGA